MIASIAGRGRSTCRGEPDVLSSRLRTRRLASAAAAALAVAVVAAGAVSTRAPAAVGASRGAESQAFPKLVRAKWIHYRAHNGRRRSAILLLPRWYSRTDNPALPLIISPHGRGVGAMSNAANWGALPALGVFAVINPGGQG